TGPAETGGPGAAEGWPPAGAAHGLAVAIPGLGAGAAGTGEVTDGAFHGLVGVPGPGVAAALAWDGGETAGALAAEAAHAPASTARLASYSALVSTPDLYASSSAANCSVLRSDARLTSYSALVTTPDL